MLLFVVVALVILLGTCSLPPKVPYGVMKDIFIPVSYRPVGFVVEYDCNPGYERNHSASVQVTCLQNYTWSTPEVFCYSEYNFKEYSYLYGIWENSI